MVPYSIYSFLKILIFILTGHSLLTRKKNVTFCIFAFTLNTLFVFLIGIYAPKYVHNEEIFKFIMYCAAFSYLLYFNLVFKESLSKKIFTLFSIWMFSTITLLIATPLAVSISSIYDITSTQNLIYFFRNSINMLFVVTSYFWIGKHYKTTLNLVSDKTIRYMSLYPFIAFLLLITNFTTPTYISQVKNFNSIYAMILFLLFIIVGYILVFLGIASASKIVSMQCDMEKLELISQTDPLTGLYNRRYIMEKLENEFKHYKKTKNKFSVIISDIDYFKKVNDTFGHDCGDLVLKKAAKNLQDTVGERGFVSRWGGEEFLILLPETELEAAILLADTIRKISEKEFIEYNGSKVSITSTFGVTVNEDHERIDDTIKKADDALFKGKKQGRNCVVFI